MIKNLRLKTTGIIAAGVISSVLFIQILLMKSDPGSADIPSYFFDITQFFSIAIFLLGVGCIAKSMSGAGVVFTGYQIFILTSLIMGIPPVPLIVAFVIASIIFIEVSQMLVFQSEVCEPILPASDAVRETERIDAYVRWLEPYNPQVKVRLEAGKRIGIRSSPGRIITIWTTVILTTALAIILLGSDSVSYVSLLFFVIFPISIVALVLLRRTKENEED